METFVHWVQLYQYHMMVRFPCFNSQTYSQKSKKIIQVSAKAMDHASKDYSQIQISGNFESNIVVPKTGTLKKSRSLGSELFLQGRGSAEDEVHENETDQGFSCSDSHGHSKLRVSDNKEDLGENRHQNATSSECVQTGSNIANCKSIFSIGDAHNLDKEVYENSDTHFSGEYGNAPADYASETAPMIVKSHSFPDISVSPRFRVGLSPPKHSLLKSKSCEHLLVLCTSEKYVYESQIQEKLQEKGDSTMGKDENDDFENYQSGGYNSCGYTCSANDGIVPVMDAESTVRNIQGEFTIHQGDEMPARDFKIKRIEEWVESLQHSAPLEKTNELPFVDAEVKHGTDVLKAQTSGKAEAKVSPGMEAAKRYISSLSATSSTAQLANHGLVVIPFFSAFVTLRVLNLSGNSIVRITAGTLPRGLHMLNLSKNSISTIGGLRELTRLRVLDLSYNKIIRIGHGLAYCSSLKELYLAGNKIGEVEGLHRLLKLNVLDLRFNKISTAKCLGQLASNYSSLYAINLEGNPAQKNVGVEQLKKHLQSLLPHLAYYNCNPTKISTSADRSARLGINAHQLDHGLRSDHKSIRKSNLGSGSHKPSSSTHGLKNHRVVSPPNRSKGKRVALPPTGTSLNRSELSTKLLNLKPQLSMRRSRSEGLLGVSNNPNPLK